MKCYLARTYNTDLGILNIIQNNLISYGVKVIDNFEEQVVSNSITDNLINIIHEVDFIVAIVTRDSSNVIFELGVAVGAKKPIFIVIEEGIEIPIYYLSATFIRINNNFAENIILPLKHFIKNLQKISPKKRKESISNNYNKNLSENLLLDLEKIRKDGNGFAFEKFVDSFFKSISSQYATSSELIKRDDGYDYALWIDELEGIISNPVLFELKYGYINKNIIEKSVLQLSRYTRDSTQISFVLFCDKNKKNIQITNLSLPVIVVDIEIFIHRVFDFNLPEAILYFRNSVAHGREL